MTLRSRQVPREALGLIVIGAIVLLTALVFTGALPGLFGGGGNKVRASFETTRQLAIGSAVRVKGFDVGKVDSIELDDDGRGATVTMKLDDSAPQLHGDAAAAIKFRSLLGGSMIVSLDPGRTTAGDLAGRTIPRQRTTTQVELDEITQDGLHADAREGLKTLLSEVPDTLRDPSDLTAVLDKLHLKADDLAGGLDAARGERRGDLQRLVVASARAVDAMNAPSEGFRRMLDGAGTTVAVTARRQAEIRQMLHSGARALPATTTTLARLEGTLELLDPLVEELLGSAGQVAPTVTSLRSTLRKADALLSDAPPLLRSLRPALANLESLSRRGRPLLDDLEPSLIRADEKILPNLAEPDPVTERPTYQMLGPGIASLIAVAGGYDAEGYFARLAAGGGERALDSAPCRTTATDPERPEIMNCAALTRLFGSIFSGVGVDPPSRQRKGGRR